MEPHDDDNEIDPADTWVGAMSVDNDSINSSQEKDPR